jgi:beta-lactamase class A
MNTLRLYHALATVTLLLFLVSCGTPAAVPPTVTPEPPTATPEPRVARGVTLDGLDVAGQTRSELAASLAALTLAPQSVIAVTGDITTTLTFKSLSIDNDATIDTLLKATANSAMRKVIRFDNTEIQQKITTLNTAVSAASGVTLQTTADPFNSQFVAGAAQQVEADAAELAIIDALTRGDAQVTLPLQASDVVATPTAAQLQDAINVMAEAWPGIVGIYVYDLDRNEVMATYNENTVFSGASVMKVPILIHAYANVPAFDADQTRWMQRMIIDSDNLSANKMLATSINGQGTESAYLGAQSMNKMLIALGLAHSYQNMPYEARDYLIGVLNYEIKRGPKQEGPPPHTDADPMLRTTPAEMSKVFIELYRCSQGTGELIALYPETLNAARCGEMLDLMHKNADFSRMMSGLPDDAYVSHKSGWIEDMQGDVGIVTTPDKRHFMMAIYVYRDIAANGGYLLDNVAGPAIGGFARLIYSAFVPAVAP